MEGPLTFGFEWPPGPCHQAHTDAIVLPPLRPPGRIEPRCHMHPGDHMRIPALEIVGESTLVKNSSVTK